MAYLLLWNGCKTVQLVHVDFELDSKINVYKFLSNKEDVSKFGAILYDYIRFFFLPNLQTLVLSLFKDKQMK